MRRQACALPGCASPRRAALSGGIDLGGGRGGVSAEGSRGAGVLRRVIAAAVLSYCGMPGGIQGAGAEDVERGVFRRDARYRVFRRWGRGGGGGGGVLPARTSERARARARASSPPPRLPVGGRCVAACSALRRCARQRAMQHVRCIATRDSNLRCGGTCNTTLRCSTAHGVVFCGDMTL